VNRAHHLAMLEVRASLASESPIQKKKIVEKLMRGAALPKHIVETALNNVLQLIRTSTGSQEPSDPGADVDT
jgi:hypothetical protein